MLLVYFTSKKDVQQHMTILEENSASKGVRKERASMSHASEKFAQGLEKL